MEGEDLYVLGWVSSGFPSLSLSRMEQLDKREREWPKLVIIIFPVGITRDIIRPIVRDEKKSTHNNSIERGQPFYNHTSSSPGLQVRAYTRNPKGILKEKKEKNETKRNETKGNFKQKNPEKCEKFFSLSLSQSPLKEKGKKKKTDPHPLHSGCWVSQTDLAIIEACPPLCV